MLPFDLVSPLRGPRHLPDIRISNAIRITPADLAALIKAIQAEITEHSPRLRARIEGKGHRILSPFAGRGTLDQRYGQPEIWFRRWGVWLIKKGDNAVVYSVWEAAKAEGRAQGLEGDALMEHTRQRAEDIFDRTQPTWDPLSTPAILREGGRSPLLKLLVMFASARVKNLNAAMRGISEYRHIPTAERTAADAGRLARKIAVPLIATSLLVYAIGEGWRRIVRGKEDKPFVQHIIGMLERVFGNWLIAGDIPPAIARALLERKTELRENILIGVIEEPLEGLVSVIRTIDDLATDAEYPSGAKRGEKKWKYEAMKSVEHAATLIGYYYGAPTQGLLQLTERLRGFGPPGEVMDFFDKRTEARREYREAKEARALTAEISKRYKRYEAFAKSIRQLQDAASDTDDAAKREEYEDRILELAKRALEIE